MMCDDYVVFDIETTGLNILLILDNITPTATIKDETLIIKSIIFILITYIRL